MSTNSCLAPKPGMPGPTLRVVDGALVVRELGEELRLPLSGRGGASSLASYVSGARQRHSHPLRIGWLIQDAEGRAVAWLAHWESSVYAGDDVDDFCAVSGLSRQNLGQLRPPYPERRIGTAFTATPEATPTRARPIPPRRVLLLGLIFAGMLMGWPWLLQTVSTVPTPSLAQIAVSLLAGGVGGVLIGPLAYFLIRRPYRRAPAVFSRVFRWLGAVSGVVGIALAIVALVGSVPIFATGVGLLGFGLFIIIIDLLCSASPPSGPGSSQD